MGRLTLTPEVLGRVAERFKALAEPARLQVLNALRDGERSVGDLVLETGLGQANLSKHLQLLHRCGFVSRRKDGLRVVYQLAGDDVFRLCDIVCGRIEREVRGEAKLLDRVGRGAAEGAPARGRRSRSR